MSLIDYKDNLFYGLGSYEERHLWKAAGFKFSKLRGAWTTEDQRVATQVEGVTWTKRALAHVEHQLKTAEISQEMSWRATTDFQPPLSEAVRAKGWNYLAYQRAGVEYALMRKDTLIADQPGLGKCSTLDCPVLTPAGWVALGALKVGDAILHPYHGVQTVEGVYDRGVLPMYRVTFSDGSSTVCGEDHLWTFRRPRYISRVSREEVWPLWETRDLADIMTRFAGYKTLRSAKLRIPLVHPLEFVARTHVIHPYVLGVILGDGSITQKYIEVTSADDDMAGEVVPLLHPDMRWMDRRSTQSPYAYAITSRRYGVNPYVTDLRRLGLMGHGSDTKFIPDEYMFDSLESRRALLQGLLDTDGYCAKDGTLQFSSNSLALVEGVRHIVWSLGGIARLTSKISASGKTHWLTTINLPVSEHPFRLIRKALRYRPKPKYEPCRLFDKIERLADAPARCIKVSRPDGLYITNDFIVTHNTIQAIGVLNADPSIRRALFVVPASLKENWRREIELWQSRGLSVGIAQTQYKEKVADGFYKNGKPKFKTITHAEFWPNTDLVIINYDILDRFPQIKEQSWHYLVCDECHALKTDTSGRTLFVLGGKKYVKADRARGVRSQTLWFTAVEANRRVFLSGTPMMSRPIELWPIAHAFDPRGLGRNWEEFAYRYCGAWTTNHGLDTSGASNLVELGEKMRATFMVRRLKREVLPELPPKRRIVVTLDSPEIKELVAREDELAQALRLYEKITLGAGSTAEEAAVGEEIMDRAFNLGLDTLDSADRISTREINLEWGSAVLGLEPPAVAILFEEMASVRRDLGLAKLSAITPWVSDFLEGGEKLLLFAYHSDVVKALAERLHNWSPAVIWGGTPLAKRQLQVDRFQNDESCRLFIGNIQAAGVGFTMTRAHDVAFAEGDWVPSMIEQCEDRACRIGQTAEKIMSYFLVANGSLDARIAQAAKLKEDNIVETMGA